MGTRVAASTRPLLVGLARSGDLALRTSYIAPAVYCTVKVNGAEVLPVKLASPPVFGSKSEGRFAERGHQRSARRSRA